MKTIFVMLLVLLLHDKMIAQAYIPTVEKGKVWEIKYPVGMGGYKGYLTKVECDTTINLVAYNNVYLCDGFGNATLRLGSIREDTTNHKVYFVDTVSVIEKIIFDYDFIQGDIFNGLTVTSVYNQVTFGQLRRHILFSSPYEWIEGVGNYIFGLYDLTPAGGEVIALTQNASNCMPLSVSNSIQPQNIEMKYATNIISVNSLNEENKHIEIFNSVGQLLFKAAFKQSTEIDISSFSKQLLIVHIYGKNEQVTQKIFSQ